MGLELRQDLKLTQQLVMTPQLQQSIKLLQLSRLELEQYVQQEMQENPLLEEGLDTADSPEETLEYTGEENNKENSEEGEKKTSIEGEISWDDYFEQTLGSTYDIEQIDKNYKHPTYENILTPKTTLIEYLLWQLKMTDLSEKESEVGIMIIGNLDDNGYLKSSISEIAQTTNVDEEYVEKVLKKIQEFDPTGIAARDLKECLLIQLRASPKINKNAEKIIMNYLHKLEKKDFKGIAKELGVSVSTVISAYKEISKLDPKPGRTLYSDSPQYIVPDIYVYKADNEYIIMLNEDGLPKLKISPVYRQLLSCEKGIKSETKDYIQEKLRSAVWLIRSIQQRQKTIYKVTESIVKFQKEFLDNGILYLKPLVLRDVAEDIGMHESTISRVTTNKYVQTPKGLFELKFFFNSSINQFDGNGVASESVRDKIKEIILKENIRKPYSDQRIVEILRESNIDIARRTVTKYREMMGILSSSKRKGYF